MIVDSIAAGLTLIMWTTLIGIIWNLSRKIDHLQHQVGEAHGLAEFTLAALTAHIAGDDPNLTLLGGIVLPTRETEKE